MTHGLIDIRKEHPGDIAAIRDLNKRAFRQVPDDVFMLLVLDAVTMHGVSGLAKYRSEFSSVT